MPEKNKKKDVDLEIFQDAVFPSLQKQHTDPVALQKAINDGYNIYEEDAEGKKTSIVFSVSKSKKEDPAPTKSKTVGPGEDPPVQSAELVMSEASSDVLAKAIAKGLGEYMKTGAQTPPVGEIKVNPSAIPEGLKLYRPIKSFTGTSDEKKAKAYRFGAWMLGGVFDIPKYAKWCQENGIMIKEDPDKSEPTIMLGRKAQSEGINTAGGILVPDVLENDIIDLRESYGKFRANARIRPMTRDTATVPRRASGLTAYFTNENKPIAESEKGWDNIGLTAKKLAALAKYSTEVLEDAIISIADDLAQEIIYAFSLKEDQCGFIGDGTGPYGDIVGAVTALTAIWTSTTNNSAGVIIGAGDTFAEITDADLIQVMGTLPEYADDGQAAWFCSRVAAFSVFGRLMRASGGVTKSEAAGALPLEYGGYPIITTQVMPRTDTASQIISIFGSLRKAADFGDRRQTTISVSDQRYWENDQVGIRGTERFDINVHDVGDGTNAGPIVGLRAKAT